MRNKLIPLAVAAALAPAVSLLGFGPVQSLPLFSRNTGAACGQCHSSAPGLNLAGLAFAQNGYRDSLGAESPGGSRGLPVSVTGMLAGGLSKPIPVAPARRTSLEGTTSSGLEIHTAGCAAGRLSFHFNLALLSDDELRSDDAYLQLDDVLANAALNLKAGHYQAELPFLSRDHRTTLRDYQTPVAFDATGLELNGRDAAWTYAAGLSISQRHTEGPNSTARIRNRPEDSYFRLERDVLGHPVGALMLFDKQDSDLPIHTWLQHIRFETATRLGSERWSVTPAYVLDRFDDRPAAGIHEHHHQLVIETLAFPDRARLWSVTARYEHDYRVRNEIDPEDHRQLVALDLARSVAANAKLAVEWAYDRERVPARHGNSVDAFVQLSY